MKSSENRKRKKIIKSRFLLMQIVSNTQNEYTYELLEHKYQKLSVASLCDQFLITCRPNFSVV